MVKVRVRVRVGRCLQREARVLNGAGSGGGCVRVRVRVRVLAAGECRARRG